MFSIYSHKFLKPMFENHEPMIINLEPMFELEALDWDL